MDKRHKGKSAAAYRAGYVAKLRSGGQRHVNVPYRPWCNPFLWIAYVDGIQHAAIYLRRGERRIRL